MNSCQDQRAQLSSIVTKGENMEGNQQFNLRWNNHTNNILQVFMEHLSSEQLVDVTLSCQGQFVKAHRMILSACSPYFQELFKHHTAKHPVVILNGIKCEDLQMIIKFMYHGEIRVQEAELDDLLAAAETLQIKGLSNVRNKYEKGEIQSQNVKKNSVPTQENNARKKATPQVLDSSRKSTKSTEKNKLPPTEPPRVRKRRKMSHTINELAKETVFTSNGVVCLNPQSVGNETDPVIPMIKVEPPDIKDVSDEDESHSPSSSEVKTLRIKGKGKPTGQKAVIVRDKARVPDKIPRPPNAFMIFANEWRRKMAFKYPNESNKEISVRLGVMWKGLDFHAKNAYFASAKKADEDHKRKYPGYYYSPKEARLRKNLKQDLMMARCLPTNIREIDAARLVKVFINVDEQQGNMAPISPKNKNNDGDENGDKDGCDNEDHDGGENDLPKPDKLIEKLLDEEKDNVCLTSVSTP
ncbi:uncharacterized protein LOC124412148 isoform X2 [Diprion similis]|uniref:uncharacterized protein LOC124412148 isoform X2 n=1 Tax=Diprion similis TaxID=362088 RepID=UPI001EF7FC6A|nr:uncharacterized protein LOC124412148 isoform X2 [Diprion similis]